MESDQSTDIVTYDKPEDERRKRNSNGRTILVHLCLAFDVCVAHTLLTMLMSLRGALECYLMFGFWLGLIALSYFFVRLRAKGSLDLVILLTLMSVFAAILSPGVSQARSKDRRITCQSHLRMVATGLLLYAQDWDDTFPGAARWSDVASVRLKPGEVQTAFRCPEARSPYSYAFNIALDRLPEPDPPVAAQVVILFEANVDSRKAAGDRNLAVHPPRHLGANNIEFAGGHAKSIKTDAEAGLRSVVSP